MKTTNKQSKKDTFFLYINTLILQIPPPEIEKTNRENWKKTREEKLVLNAKITYKICIRFSRLHCTCNKQNFRKAAESESEDVTLEEMETVALNGKAINAKI